MIIVLIDLRVSAAVMKSSIFWTITSCISLKVTRRFGGTYRLHLEGRKISQAGDQREVGSNQSCFTLVSCLAYFPILKMEATCFS
jgi:hypothetical protein